MVDLSTIEGLNEEQTAQLTALFDNEVGGLKNKVDQLLGEKKSVQAGLSEKEQALEDARKAAVAAHEEKLISEGKVDELKKHYEDQLASTTAELKAAADAKAEALLDRDRKDVLNQINNLVDDDFKDVSSAMLSNMLKISYNDEGQAITSFEHEGKVVASSVDEFKGWAGEQPSFKRILKGVDSGGAGTERSGSGASSAGNTIEQKLAQRLKAQGIN